MWDPPPHPSGSSVLLLMSGGRAADSSCMDAAERYEVLSRYAEHMRRFEEMRAKHGPSDLGPGTRSFLPSGTENLAMGRPNASLRYPGSSQRV